MILPLITTFHRNLAELTSLGSEAKHCSLGTFLHAKKETRGVMGATPEPKTFTAEGKLICSIDAMRNGGECEACQ